VPHSGGRGLEKIVYSPYAGPAAGEKRHKARVLASRGGEKAEKRSHNFNV